MTVAKHRTGTVTSGDVELFYRAFGRPGATPILIVHGLSFFSYDWIGEFLDGLE
jgi:pimeloyl-ACP methyl ester carboxylesterase